MSKDVVAIAVAVLNVLILSLSTVILYRITHSDSDDCVITVEMADGSVHAWSNPDGITCIGEIRLRMSE